MKTLVVLWGLVPFFVSAETFSLNADWRFAKATKPIPLAQAKASVETAGAWLVLMTHAVRFGYDQWRDPAFFYTLLEEAAKEG